MTDTENERLARCLMFAIDNVPDDTFSGDVKQAALSIHGILERLDGGKHNPKLENV